MFEKRLKQFFHGKSEWLEYNPHRKNLFSIPLQQSLDINDLIWYCNEIRRQIEKSRYHSSNNLHPLLKYVRSNSFHPSRANAHQPATTTTAATTTTSTYSFSNVLSTVMKFCSIISKRNSVFFFIGKFYVYNACTSTTVGIQCSTTIWNGMCRNDWKVNIRWNFFIGWDSFVFVLVKLFNVFYFK